MLRPISPTPPSGMTRRVPGASSGGATTSIATTDSSGLAGGAGDLRQRATGGCVAVGAEIAEIDTVDVVHERDLVLDEGGLRLLGTHEWQAHARTRDAAEAMQDVLGRDRAGHVRHGGAHERLERTEIGRAHV